MDQLPVSIIAFNDCMIITVTVGDADYDTGPYVIMFPAEQTSVPFSVSINDDMIVEGNENFTLTIDPSSLPTGVTVGGAGQATVTIVDDDRKL